MDNIRDILERVQAGEISPEDAEKELKYRPFEDIGYAKVDLHRKIRQGVAEVIYGNGKTAEQISGIAKTLIDNNQTPVLITKLSGDKADTLGKNFNLQYNDRGNGGVIGEIPKPNGIGKILIVTAGTGDIPIAEEASVTAEVFGNETVKLYDAGVAGIHRLLSYTDEIMSATVIIAIAGMEGALASVLGGIADCPIIAVPTSVGYGTSFGGVSALLSMLNSCAGGVSVVNIDNGFGAAVIASRINHTDKKAAGNR